MTRRRVSAESDGGEDVITYRKQSVTTLLRMGNNNDYDGDNDAATTEASSCKEEVKTDSCGHRVYKKAQSMGMIRLLVWLVITIVYSWLGALAFRLAEGSISNKFCIKAPKKS
jgi:hypothetical protein